VIENSEEWFPTDHGQRRWPNGEGIEFSAKMMRTIRECSASQFSREGQMSRSPHLGVGLEQLLTGPWYLARSKALSVGLSNAYFKSLGLPTLIDEVKA
jgi:hypothetical protein